MYHRKGPRIKRRNTETQPVTVLVVRSVEDQLGPQTSVDSIHSSIQHVAPSVNAGRSTLRDTTLDIPLKDADIERNHRMTEGVPSAAGRARMATRNGGVGREEEEKKVTLQ